MKTLLDNEQLAKTLLQHIAASLQQGLMFSNFEQFAAAILREAASTIDPAEKRQYIGFLATFDKKERA